MRRSMSHRRARCQVQAMLTWARNTCPKFGSLKVSNTCGSPTRTQSYRPTAEAEVWASPIADWIATSAVGPRPAPHHRSDAVAADAVITSAVADAAAMTNGAPIRRVCVRRLMSVSLSWARGLSHQDRRIYVRYVPASAMDCERCVITPEVRLEGVRPPPLHLDVGSRSHRRLGEADHEP